jgi:LMBR1-like membrane protein
MEVYWRIFYWTNFISGFLFLPYIMYFFQSAAFTVLDKAKDALKTLIIWTSIPALLGILAWLVLLITGKINIKETPRTVIALTNA